MFLQFKKMNQTTKKIKAIDLMTVDLHTVHSAIRSEAKELGCEQELNLLKNEFLDSLRMKRILLTSNK